MSIHRPRGQKNNNILSSRFYVSVSNVIKTNVMPKERERRERKRLRALKPGKKGERERNRQRQRVLTALRLRLIAPLNPPIFDISL